MRNHPIIVQKYGGVCLETPAKIRTVARSLADLDGRGHRVVAIVSGMGKTTDQLIEMAYQVSPTPNRRELDMLLTTGERISMFLMSMALSDLGVPAISCRIQSTSSSNTHWIGRRQAVKACVATPDSPRRRHTRRICGPRRDIPRW
jgi:aspartokinase